MLNKITLWLLMFIFIRVYRQRYRRVKQFIFRNDKDVLRTNFVKNGFICSNNVKNQVVMLNTANK